MVSHTQRRPQNTPERNPFEGEEGQGGPRKPGITLLRGGLPCRRGRSIRGARAAARGRAGPGGLVGCRCRDLTPRRLGRGPGSLPRPADAALALSTRHTIAALGRTSPASWLTRQARAGPSPVAWTTITVHELDVAARVTPEGARGGARALHGLCRGRSA